MSDDELKDLLLALADELAKCQSLAGRSARGDIVELLDHRISVNIERRDAVQDDLRKIVMVCGRFENGVQQLLDRIADKESATLQWPAVTQAADAYFAAAAQARRDADAAAKAGGAGAKAAAAAQNKLALVIGISHYEHGQAAGRELGPKQFSELNFADHDARSCYDFLVNEGSYEVLPPLLNEEACLHHILHGLDQLRQACELAAEKNPLVVVFFSGHGATDAAGRNYLVPHDARRDDLFATALWNRTFNAALAEIKTDRLVLFVDACHAGAIAAEGVKDAGLLQYDPRLLVDKGDQRRHCLVASCEAGQVSREYNGHGIFTAHLLELMKCDPGVVDFDDEVVDLWELYDKLKLRVKTTASEKFGAVQVPYANVDSRTGIVITIDAPRRAQRQKRELDYLKQVIAEFERMDVKNRISMHSAIERYLEGDVVEANLRQFCSLFKEQAAEYRGDGVQLTRLSGLLAWRYKRDTDQATQRPTADQHRDLGSTTLTPSSPATAPGADARDQFAAAPAARQAAEAPRTIAKPVMSAAPVADRRRLTPEDCKHVLEPIWNPDFLAEARSLEALMLRLEGVSRDEVSGWVMNNRPTDADAQALWEPAGKEIWSRFKERWAATKPMAMPMPMPQGAFALRSLRGGGDDAF